MEPDRIIQTVTSLPGITSLNALQQAVLRCGAARIKLIAPTGSGKTIAFGINLLKRLKPEKGRITGVVIVPTRELALQVRDVLSRMMPGLRTLSLYGGHPMAEETASLQTMPDIIMATPGRLLDHLLRHTLTLAHARELIIDEYDKCLELGFLGEMKRIVARMPALAGIVLTSATAAVELPDFIDFSQARTLDFGSDTTVNRGHATVYELATGEKDKLEDARRLLGTLSGSRTMVFVNHRESAERLYQGLRKAGIPAGLYHGGLEQQMRERALVLFESMVTPVLITTDLGARGLDISDVGNVVHYHLPVSEETWRHRNGRTARMGRDGNVWVLRSPVETLPEYIKPDVNIASSSLSTTGAPSFTPRAALYFNAGKKDKISKGDILGFLIKTGGLTPSDIDRITVKERCAYAAISRQKTVKDLLDTLNAGKIKNKKVRVSLIE